MTYDTAAIDETTPLYYEVDKTNGINSEIDETNQTNQKTNEIDSSQEGTGSFLSTTFASVQTSLGAGVRNNKNFIF